MLDIIGNLNDREILILTLYGEARGEPIAGLVAVGTVIRNRVHSGRYKSYKEACLAPEQFSCWNKDDPNYNTLIALGKNMIASTPNLDPAFRRCLLVAMGIIDWSLNDETKSAENYMTTKEFNSQERPSWADHPINPLIIGKHTFFNV